MNTIKQNILLNTINTITSIIFPVITFPYVARVLLPDGIGAVNLLNSIVSYIVLLTSLGIPMYAVKEIAKYRDDNAIRDRITVEILVLSTGLCLLGYVAVWLLAEFVPNIIRQRSLFYVLSLSILFTSIGVNWFYQGIEDFKFITIRAIAIRTLATAALFIFVNDSRDLLIYGFILVGSTVGNNIINFVHLRKHINFKLIAFNSLQITRHLHPALQVFALNLIISLYIQLNTVMLGFLSGDDAVGYFTAGTKISHIGLTVISSISTVLLPRCSNLVKNGDMEGFKSVIQKSLNVVLALSLPMMLGLMVLAKPITLIFCGAEYIDSIPVLYLNAPVIVIISLTNIMGIQILYPMDKIKLVIYSVSGGAIMNIIFNLLLIPSMGATGAAISTLIAESSVLFIQLTLGLKFFPFHLRHIFTIRYYLSALIMALSVYLSTFMISTMAIQMSVGLVIGIVSYTICLVCFKDPVINDFKNLINSQFTHAKVRI